MFFPITIQKMMKEDRKRETETDRQRQTARDRQTEIERQTDRQRQKDRDRQNEQNTMTIIDDCQALQNNYDDYDNKLSSMITST